MVTLNLVPKFTTEETVETAQKEVKETVVTTEEEKETPAEPPADTSEEVKKPNENVEDTNLERTTLGLQKEVLKLKNEIVELRGQKRELKKEELFKAEQKLDELKDVNPEDASLVERILRSKGYVRKDEVDEMYYKAVQDEELAKFLEKYPEYKPQNDPNDTNWGTLQRELEFYRMPKNPRQIPEILERAHKATFKESDRSLPVKKRAVETASVGAGGTQRSSSGKTLSPTLRARYEQGGWSEEEIRSIESRL